ncbi:MAG: hypothetical protein Harvfovirus58_11 [Harvfovirus sp.]|uniref:Uncharacterized protein n=1 Tax=Harvfovirus sp. TaxID=2487768 RepID=A0A3G5A7D4_9VIRU|nr:MAG: hypothetical protein Harvfovirus58_11 [Harvfovirus sp.]
MGQSPTIETFTDKFIDACIDKMERISYKNKDVILISINYLKRSDVRKKTAELFVSLNLVKVRGNLGELVDVPYLEIIGTDNNDKMYRLKYLPCCTCPCIGYEII